MKDITYNVRKELHELAKHVIGLYQLPDGKIIPVIRVHEDKSFTTFEILRLYGSSEDHFSSDHFSSVVVFPENKTLAEMLNEPFEFQRWVDKSFNTKSFNTK